MVGQRIKMLRKEKDLTAAQLANIIGITQSALTKLENGNSGKRFEILVKLARALGVSIDALFPEMDAPQEDTALQTAEPTTDDDDDLEDLE